MKIGVTKHTARGEVKPYLAHFRVADYLNLRAEAQKERRSIQAQLDVIVAAYFAERAAKHPVETALAA